MKVEDFNTENITYAYDMMEPWINHAAYHLHQSSVFTFYFPPNTPTTHLAFKTSQNKGRVSIADQFKVLIVARKANNTQSWVLIIHGRECYFLFLFLFISLKCIFLIAITTMKVFISKYYFISLVQYNTVF